MPDPSNTPRFFEQSGTDPGAGISASLPDLTAEIEGNDPSMTMIEHITELRTRVLTCATVLFAAICAGFYLALPAIELFKTMAPKNVLFVQIAPGEVLMASLSLSFYIGVALSAPVILYHVLRFVLPGLTRREKSMVIWAVIGGALLFVAGVIFSYFFVASSAIYFLVDYGKTVAQIQFRIEDYISFCSALLFVTGLMFELPMVLFLLSFTGLITSEKLMREWRWATLIIFITAAIVTPTQDPFSMTIVGLAMVVLYGLSIIPIKLCGR